MFDHIEVQIGLAHERLQTFKDEARGFIQSYPQRNAQKLHPKGNGEWELITYWAVAKTPPVRLSVLAGEIIHLMRSSLDHIVYQLSLERASSPRDLETIEFPIFKEKDPFNAKILKGGEKGKPARGSGLHKIRFVQPLAQAVIKNLQPYIGGQQAIFHPLWILYELSNINKHRRLHLIGNPHGVVEPQPGHYEMISRQDFSSRPVKDGAIISKFRIRERPGFQGKVRVIGLVPPQVVFDEAMPFPENYASDILEGILRFIETEVIPRLNPEKLPLEQ